jgi:hypothetical protein
MEKTYKISRFVAKINHLLKLPYHDGGKLIDANEGGHASIIGSDIWNQVSKFFPQSKRKIHYDDDKLIK